MIIFAIDIGKGIDYELLGNGTIGTDERGSQRHHEGRLGRLKLVLSLFFAELAQKAIDKLWNEGKFDQAKLDELRGQHLRIFPRITNSTDSNRFLTQN